MIRWTSRVKFLFLLPAVLWVLAFTVFPLGYSLYLSFHDVERKVVITGREQVPVLDDAGNPVLKRDGTPRTRTVVNRELQTTFTWNGLANFARAFGDAEVHKRGAGHRDLRDRGGRDRDRARPGARLAVQPPHPRPAGAALDHDPADLRDADRGRLPVLHDLLRGRRPARVPGHPVAVRPALGAGVGDPGRHLAVDAVLLPGLPRRAAGHSGRADRVGDARDQLRNGSCGGT